MLRSQGILKIRLGNFTSFQTFEEISKLMNKRLAKADLKARHPPVVHVRMLTTGVGHVNGTPTAQLTFITVVKVLQPVQVMQIPLDGGMFAIDLEGIERFMAPGIPR